MGGDSLVRSEGHKKISMLLQKFAPCEDEYCFVEKGVPYAVSFYGNITVSNLLS